MGIYNEGLQVRVVCGIGHLSAILTDSLTPDMHREAHDSLIWQQGR